MNRQLVIALFVSACISSTAIAQEESLPIWSGGIGTTEREWIEQKQNDYALKIIFTGDKGMYVSNVGVVITAKNGTEVVNTITQGPVLLVDLAPGRYDVKTSAEGNQKNFKVNLGTTLTTQHVRFPIKDTPTKASGISL